MGSTVAAGYAEQVALGNIRLLQALVIHLTNNHYPPHPAYMANPCKRAIEKCNAGNSTGRVRMPKGVKHRRYGSLVPAYAIVESFHLESFLDYDGEEYND